MYVQHLRTRMYTLYVVITLLQYVHTYVCLFTYCMYVVYLNGSTHYQGRVEVYYNGEWGTVCDDGWDLNDAQVVCRQLGFGPVIDVRHDAYYGEGSGQVWLGKLNCTGTESNIEDCSHSGWGIEDCSHTEDAGVECLNCNEECMHMYMCSLIICMLLICSTSCKWTHRV